jgi:hypothetical protein
LLSGRERISGVLETPAQHIVMLAILKRLPVNDWTTDFTTVVWISGVQ